MNMILTSFGNFCRKIRNDNSGLALIEFAYSAPILVALTGYGLEMANLALVNHNLSQSAMSVADNMSRVGADSALSQRQIRESDVVDSFIGIKRQTEGLDFGTRGRVILSSLQQNASGGQWIKWQRCWGAKNVQSSYGLEGQGATGTSFAGMGPPGAVVQSPPGTAVMFVEIIYDYKSLFSNMFVPTSKTIKYHSSFVVRDERDLTQIYNPAPTSPVMSCSVYSST